MNEVVLEWIGYVASMIVLISLLMSSIKKLRWINLVGATLFGFYGFMIGSIPTGVMNLGIVLIDIYFLVKMYQTKDYFRVLPIEENNGYLKMFLDFYNEDIKNFKNINAKDILDAKVKFYVLRNMTPAGIFIADEYEPHVLEIKFDYVIPLYRDFKVGNFVFETQREHFRELGYKKFISFTDNNEHISYVKRMGFVEDSERENCYVKPI